MMLRQLFFVVLFALPATVFAHSPLVSVSPADGAKLDAAPAEIVMVFKGPVKLIKVDMTKRAETENKGALGGLFGGDKGEAVSLQSDFLMKVKTRHEIALPSLMDGTYVIAWRAMGADGHVTKGEFSFSTLGE